MGRYYVAGIPFDSENSLKHYGVKNMEWGKHKFGIDADDRYIKWLKNAGMNIGKFATNVAQNVAKGATTAANTVGSAVNKGANFVTGNQDHQNANAKRSEANTYNKQAANPVRSMGYAGDTKTARPSQWFDKDAGLTGRDYSQQIADQQRVYASKAAKANQEANEYERRANNAPLPTVNRTANQLGSAAGNAGKWAGQQAQNAGKAIGTAAGNAGKWAGQQAQNAGKAIGNAAGNAGNWAGQAAKNVGNFVTGDQARKDVQDARNNGGVEQIKNAQNAYNQTLPGMIENAPNVVDQAREGIGGFFDRVGDWGRQAAGNVGNWAGQTAQNVGNWAGQTAQNIGNFVTGDQARKDVQNAQNDLQNAQNSFFIGRQGRVNNAQNAYDQAQNAYGQTLPGIVESIGNGQFFDRVGDQVREAAGNVGNWAGQAAQNVGNFVTGDQARKDVQDARSHGGVEQIKNAQNAYNQTFPGMIENAPNVVDQTREGIGGFFDRVGDQVREAAGNVGNAVSGISNNAAEGAKGFINSAGKWVSGAANNVKNAASKAASDATKGASGFINSAGKWVSNTAQNVGNLAGQAAQAAQNVGNAIGKYTAPPRVSVHGDLSKAPMLQRMIASGEIPDPNSKGPLLDWAGQAAQNVGQAVNKARNGAGEFFDRVGDWGREAAGNVGNWAGQAAQNVGNAVQNAGQAVGDFVNYDVTGNGYRQQAQDWRDYLNGNPPRDNMSALTSSAEENVRKNEENANNSLFGRIGNWAGQAAQNVGNAVSGAAQNVGNTVDQATEQARNGVGGFFDRVGDWGREAAGNVGNAVSGAAQNVGNWAGQTAQNVGNLVSEMANPRVQLNTQQMLDSYKQYLNDHPENPQSPKHTEWLKDQVRNDPELRAFYEQYMKHSAIDDKPEGVSDAFWAKFTAEGGTREEYERDWR